MTAVFDPQRYKTTTRAQWQDAAEAWHRWGPAIEDWLGASTERMLDSAGIGPGSRVLDVAAGAGGQSLAAARRVGPNGRVLATDISPAILEYAEKAATEAGLTNISTRELDGENLAVDEGSFDAVISRVGLIYFPDQQAALAGMRAALRPGGRLSTVVYSTADRNGFFSIPVGIIRRRAELPPPALGQPGPFSLGGPGVAEKALVRAGFRDVTVEAVLAPVRMASAADCVAFERDSFGALHQMLSGLPSVEQVPAGIYRLVVVAQDSASGQEVSRVRVIAVERSETDTQPYPPALERSAFLPESTRVNTRRPGFLLIAGIGVASLAMAASLDEGTVSPISIAIPSALALGGLIGYLRGRTVTEVVPENVAHNRRLVSTDVAARQSIASANASALAGAALRIRVVDQP